MDLPVRRHVEPRARQPLELLRVRFMLEVLGRADRVAPHRERARGRYRRIELAYRAGRGVARVRERRLAGLRALLVEGGERRPGHIDLTAHLDQRWGILDPQWDLPDRAQVLRDLLADLPIAARGAAGEDAVLVHEGDREAVDLRLGDVLDGLDRRPIGRGQLAHAGVPGAELLLVAGVRQRVHRLQVPSGLELVERRGTHALGRRVGRQELGVLDLEVAQLVQQRVVVGVRDVRVVEDVVAAVVVLDLAPQLGGALLRGLLGRRCLTQPLARPAGEGGRGRTR